jgi:hypothetical protein
MKVRVDSDHRTTRGTGSQIVHELAIMESVVDQVVCPAAIDRCGTNRSKVARLDPSTIVTTFFPTAISAGGWK